MLPLRWQSSSCATIGLAACLTARFSVERSARFSARGVLVYHISGTGVGGAMDPAWIPPWRGRCPGASHLTFVFHFWIHFWPIENAPKIHPPKRHPKISNFRPCGAQASFLHPFREPFWDSFLMNTLKSRNLLKRNRHRTGALQSPIQASHFFA